MERLFKIDLKDYSQYLPAIVDAVQRIHQQGKVHTDLHPSNIMLKSANEIQIIDFGHAGSTGQMLPPDHLCQVYKGWERFETQIDILVLEKLKNIC
jgi:serine/threonine protein kinase